MNSRRQPPSRRFGPEWASTWAITAGLTVYHALFLPSFWLSALSGTKPRAWDGTGHYAAAHIYYQQIFPDTFGWIGEFFGGMPFPNFYPPVFFFLYGCLASLRVPSALAFDWLAALPMLLLPATVFRLARHFFGGNPAAATASALASIPLLLDHRFVGRFPSGLNYSSTFDIGLYTQPLGFLWLCLWIVSFRRTGTNRRGIAVSALHLALTVLSNVFCAVVAVLWALTEMAFRISAVARRSRAEGDPAGLLGRAASLALALALTLFWMVPMGSTYQFFVTRPFSATMSDILTPAMWCWYTLAALGLGVWWGQDRRRAIRFATPLLLLAGVLCLQGLFQVEWAPLQFPRFQAVLNLMLAVPVGVAFHFAFARLVNARPEFHLTAASSASSRSALPSRSAPLLRALLIFLILFNLWIFARPTVPGLSFFPRTRGPVDSILEFAKDRTDGRYLVELPNPEFPVAAFDARAIAALLGRQGNESATVVYREASPNSLFFVPLANSISAYSDSFGISSTLADDLSFSSISWRRKLRLARWIGVGYLILISAGAKSNATSVGAVRVGDFGPWSVFQVEGTPPIARVLNALPALVLDRPTFKLRTSGQLDATRLAEEQFHCACFDVSLAFAPGKGLDDFSEELDAFGALVVGDYRTRDREGAYAKLRAFSQQRLLVLMPSDHPLRAQIRANSVEFPNLLLVGDLPATIDRPVNSLRPSRDYTRSPVRRIWNEVREALEKHRVPVEGGPSLILEKRRGSFQLRHQGAPKPAQRPVPVLIAATYSPHWSRADGEPVYATTPFFMLTFAKGDIRLDFGRRPFEKAAASGSGIALILLLGLWISGRR